MCGIAGFVNFKEDLSGRYYQEIGENMGEVLTHRGPDAKGIWQGKTRFCPTHGLPLLTRSAARSP